MLITHEMDYTVRCLRALYRNEMLSATEIAQMEHMPQAVTYKMLKGLNKCGLIKSQRGAQGGYMLNCDPAKLTLVDVFTKLGIGIYLKECIEPGATCDNNCDGSCYAHFEFLRIQKVIEEEFSRHTLKEMFDGVVPEEMRKAIAKQMQKNAKAKDKSA